VNNAVFGMYCGHRWRTPQGVVESLHGKPFREYSPNQIMALPTPSLEEWLPADHPVYFISDTVDQFDL